MEITVLYLCFMTQDVCVGCLERENDSFFQSLRTTNIKSVIYKFVDLEKYHFTELM